MLNHTLWGPSLPCYPLENKKNNAYFAYKFLDVFCLDICLDTILYSIEYRVSLNVIKCKYSKISLITVIDKKSLINPME